MSIHWPETDELRRFPANSRDVETRMQRLGSRQKQLLRLDQAIGAGLSERAVERRAASGRLHRLHDGVFALHGPPFTPQQLYLAAHFACGPESLIGGFCSAALFSLVDEMPRVPEIISPKGAGRARSGINVRRVVVDPRDRVIRHGIPCTRPARTIVDCAHRAGAAGTEALIMAADSKRLLDRRRLEELAEEGGRPGIAHVRAIVTDDPEELRTQNELRMRRICRAAGVPAPLCNQPIEAGGRTFIPDFCWPEARLIVEADSWRWHGGRQASESDRDRDQILIIAGWRVVRFTRDQIRNHPEEVGTRLRALLAELVAQGR
jgi:hypothetical protein